MDFIALFWSTESLIIERGCPIRNEWNFVGRISPNRSWFSTVLLDGNLIFVGGEISGNSTNSVQSYNLNNLQCTELAPLLTPRHDVGVAVIGGYLYAVGGNNNGIALDTVERYDPKNNTWEYVAPMLFARDKVGVAKGVNNLLYAVGGYNNNAERKFLESTECFDPLTNTWSRLADMDTGRQLPGVAAGGRYLVAVGGFNYGNLNTVEAYDMHTGQWTYLPPLMNPRRSVGCAFLGNGESLLAFGGFRSNDVEVLNLGDEAWKQRTSLDAVDNLNNCYPYVNKWFHLLIPTYEIA